MGRKKAHKIEVLDIMPILYGSERNKITRKRLDKSAIAFLAVGGLLVVLAYVSYALYLSEEQHSSGVSLAGNYYRTYSLFSVLAAISFAFALRLVLARRKHGRLLQVGT